MRTPSPRGLTPRVVEAIAQKVEKLVSKRLKSSQLSTTSTEEKDFVAGAVEYFLVNQKSVTEPQLAELASVLSSQIVDRRLVTQRNANAARDASALPPLQQPRPQVDVLSQPNINQHNERHRTVSSPRLPPISSPRRQPQPPPPAPSSVAPFATNNAIEVKSPRARLQIAKSTLSAALDSQIRSKEADRKASDALKQQEISERLAQVADGLDTEEQQKLLRKQLNALMSEEYSHYARGRTLQDKISKLESHLSNHLEKKKNIADDSEYVQAQKIERQRRRSEERSGLEAQLAEQRMLARQRENKDTDAGNQFCIGTSPEEVRTAAQLRKKSLAQGLSEQIRQQQNHRSTVSPQEDAF
ncbi:Hypothetical protein, putative [Bodo saltans]|uniref:Uncharacterized protein n=1 Tax=Bodo saltans TaxID=75058 RepID=A0A0S4IQM2_BODSA|nr:Hypothetical protein, putative [Bodo saltans]|eukprot:CUE91228.1 Hypothetical protein, putative [Bodo saltans]